MQKKSWPHIKNATRGKYEATLVHVRAHIRAHAMQESFWGFLFKFFRNADFV